MKGYPSVGTNALLAGTESPEILTSFGNDVVVKLNHYSPFKLFSYANVQEAPWSPHNVIIRNNKRREEKRRKFASWIYIYVRYNLTIQEPLEFSWWRSSSL